MRGCVGCRACREFLEKTNFSCPDPEIESRFLGSPARSLDITAEEVTVQINAIRRAGPRPPRSQVGTSRFRCSWKTFVANPMNLSVIAILIS